MVDLFAGSGALAIEALSRGARFALLVDNGTEARALLRANVEALGLGGVTRIWRADATKLGDAPAGGPFGLAFLDPPYGQNLAGPRSPRWFRAAGSKPTRSASSRRRPRRRSSRRQALRGSTNGFMATRGSRSCGRKRRGARGEEQWRHRSWRPCARRLRGGAANRPDRPDHDDRPFRADGPRLHGPPARRTRRRKPPRSGPIEAASPRPTARPGRRDQLQPARAATRPATCGS